MYKVLNKKEINEFTEKYFKIWEGDINRVSCIEYDNTKEYLINDHYIFIITH